MVRHGPTRAKRCLAKCASRYREMPFQELAKLERRFARKLLYTPQTHTHLPTAAGRIRSALA